MILPRLLLLTDRSQLPTGHDLVDTVGTCVAAGATHVVLRELDLSRQKRARLADGLADVGAAVIAAHEPLPGCVGVHLPSGGQASVADTPRPLRDDTGSPGGSPGSTTWRSDGSGGRAASASRPPLVGRSCHSPEDVASAAEEGVAYATLSPYARSDSKPGYGPPLPPDAYEGHPIPVYALGGVGPGNAAKALATGAHGVAVMGAVMRADDPADVVRKLLVEVST